MTEKPLVSVIINCYNGEKYLRQAIDSVIAQTYENWEVVFWDNQSTDSTREIVESYNCSKIHYYYAPTHTALGEARNMAVEKANGEYINFLDADDVWSSNKLDEQVNQIVPGDVELVYTPFALLLEGDVDEGMIKVFYELYVLQNKKVADYKTLLKHNFMVFSSVLLKKNLYKEVGGINNSFRQYEDYELLLKCALETRFSIANKACTKYRIHNTNGSSENSRIIGYNEFNMILNSLPESGERNKAMGFNEARLKWSSYKCGVMSKGEFVHYLVRGGLYRVLPVMLGRIKRAWMYKLNRRAINRMFRREV